MSNTENINNGRIKERYQNQTEKADYECASCGEWFDRAENLKKHIDKVHKRHKEHSCEFCENSFFHADHLEVHIKKFHEEYKHDTTSLETFLQVKIEELPQESTAHIFSSPKENIHTVQFHGGGKNHKCGSCRKKFTTTSHLRSHIHTIHDCQKDFKCYSCGKLFSQASNLKRHFHSVHQGHKDHKCEFCGKSFSQPGDLKRHMQTFHEGHKDYNCNSCDKST